MAVRVVRGPGNGAPVHVSLPADANSNFAFGQTVTIQAATSSVVPSASDLIIGRALGQKSGTPPVVDVELFEGSLLEVTENIQASQAFAPGSRIWLNNGVPGRPPATPGSNASFYLVLRTTVLSPVKPGDLPQVSYLVVPFGLKHGWYELA